MKIIFSEQAWQDYLHWRQRHDRKLFDRINGLISECTRTPFKGTGRPDPLEGSLSGWWSRRINQEHRLVYRPSDEGLHIAQRRYHD